MRVCIFCGAKAGNSPEILRQVEVLMDLLIENDFSLVYGGGMSGIMGVIASRFLEGGKEVIGIRPVKLIKEEDAHHGLTELIVVNDMFERKAKMMEMADVFIALPGGIGTLDEIVEVYTQVKIGFTDKLCIILNVDNYYEGLVILLDRMRANGFLREEDQSLLFLAENPETLMKRILQYKPAH